jgi:2-oxoisovalerate dehydrogenase E1 component beta subunit
MQLTYRQAITAALREEMERDKDVYLIGEDIGLGGGAFGVTKGFLKAFGPMRVVDTPLAESGFVGVAVGAAHKGLRAVVEIQFADFVTETFKMLVDYAAGAHFRGAGPVPITIRLPSGALKSAGAYHSHNPEAWFFHTPGLKIAAPATPYDAKGLLKAAIRDNNPVLFLEYKKLYNLPLSQIPEGDFTVPIGRGRVIREGKDITLITHGTTVYDALRAAEAISAEGVEVEVVDLRSILPFDRELILSSVKKTGRALIVHEDHKTGGVGAEWAALIAEEAFESLDAPVRWVGALDTPIPYSPPLEEYFLPNAQKMTEALRDLAAY